MPDSVRELIESYRSDPQSSFRKLSHGVRVKHERLLARITKEHGHRSLKQIRARNLVAWHDGWLGKGKIATAHSLVSRLRVVLRFGATILEDKECRRLSELLTEMRFEGPLPRKKALSSEQARQIRAKARQWFGWYSLALAQAFQFELRLNQKSVIGEWVPIGETEQSNVRRRAEGREEKWVKGLRWSGLDDQFVLRHVSGKRAPELQFDIKNARMVMEELAIYAQVSVEELTRDHLPHDGPIIINDVTGLPWSTAEFRRKWRLVADNAGIPKNVMNMDSGKSRAKLE
ncbi:hypothetical protein [Bradyrhizobium sp. WSM4349]|uniref:hypothetical protein n=1 Tax=Bradyrhizobium sp. WSM4349 TaxID=1040988 RepID=UPI0007C4E863|nr:hypothetical protein [Bradyrhizobium sp. WSM4349]